MIYPDGSGESVCMGGSFGVSPSMEKQLMTGVMRTKVDDCQVRLYTKDGNNCELATQQLMSVNLIFVNVVF